MRGFTQIEFSFIRTGTQFSYVKGLSLFCTQFFNPPKNKKEKWKITDKTSIASWLRCSKAV